VAPEVDGGSQPSLDELLVQPGLTFARPLPMIEFAVPPGARSPAPPVEGRWRLTAPAAAEGFAVHVDGFGLAIDPRYDVRTLPDFDFELVQDGSRLLPVRRGSVAADHQSWEWLIEPGVVWSEAVGGAWHRALLPFALVERNANCVHNGILALRFRAGDPGSRAVWQVASETCAYFQFDAWGRAAVEFRPAAVPTAEDVRRAHRAELSHRWPVRPITALPLEHPGADPADFGSAEEVPPDSMTAFGVIVDGVHYAGGCATRTGPYPFCDQLILPSYSLAKSIFAGLALARMEAKYPGSAAASIAEFVPECALAGGWDVVTIADSIDMATGRFDAVEPEADEQAAVDSELFLAEDHATRIRYACGRYTRRMPPGSHFAYHTSDTYIAGAAMAELLRRHEGPDRDLYRDLVVSDLWDPLGLSPVLRDTRRTRDAIAQPFTGWGLLLLRDDVARLASWLVEDDGIVDGQRVLDDRLLEGALHRSTDAPGLPAGAANLRYRNGFWGLDVAEIIGCPEPVWVPFMSGYGGIVVALFPNGVAYYYFSDGNTWRWRQAIIGADRIRPLCTDVERPGD
jgi:CubicO group peptidase (beta-lactamase class C family)